jgi:deazaflavin-dependent oxidoreductase (nitroreductase family)
MGVYQRTLDRFATSKGLRWLQSKAMTPLDLKLRNSRFAPSRFGVDAPLSYLTTTGRRSGEPRTVPLLYVTVDPDRPTYAAVASNWGTENHPGWSFNLEKHPKATLDIDGDIREVLARHASDVERTQIWESFDGVWPGYEKYREIAPRDIKVFVFEPLTS